MSPYLILKYEISKKNIKKIFLRGGYFGKALQIYKKGATYLFLPSSSKKEMRLV